MPSTHVVVANPCRRYKPSDCLWLQHLLFFFHISCLLLHNLIDFKLTGLWSLVKLLFWAQRSRKIIWLIPRSAMHLMPKTRVGLLLALFLTKALLRLLHVFPSYIYSAPSLFFFISFWLIFERERQREIIAFDFVDLAFTFVTLSAINLQSFLQRITFNSKFLFLLHIIYL